MDLLRIQTILDHPDKTDKRYMLEVDLKYPSNIHYEHNADSLARKRLEVPKEWMSDYQRNLLQGIFGVNRIK